MPYLKLACAWNIYALRPVRVQIAYVHASLCWYDDLSHWYVLSLLSRDWGGSKHVFISCIQELCHTSWSNSLWLDIHMLRWRQLCWTGHDAQLIWTVVCLVRIWMRELRMLSRIVPDRQVLVYVEDQVSYLAYGSYPILIGCPCAYDHVWINYWCWI